MGRDGIYGWWREKDKNRSAEEGEDKYVHNHRMIGSADAQNNDGTFALRVADGMLTHPELRFNALSAIQVNTVANRWFNDIEFRANGQYKWMDRTKAVGTGDNPTANVLDLANGSGSSVAGDVFVFTWVQEGAFNNNMTGITLWLKRIGAGGNSPNSTIRASLFDVTSLAEQDNDGNYTGALANPASGINVSPITLDQANYYTAALNYAEVAFNDPSEDVAGTPIYMNVNLNAREINDVILEENHVYAIVVYLNNPGAETNTMSAFGSDDPTVDSKTRFYFGSSGWSGSLAEDANVKRMYHVLNRTCDFAVDQISFFSESGQTLGDVEVESIAVVSDGDLTDDNIQETTGKHRNSVIGRKILNNLKLADMQTHVEILEGKAYVPRRYHLNITLKAPYTGTLTIEFNFWTCLGGNPYY